MRGVSLFRAAGGAGAWYFPTGYIGFGSIVETASYLKGISYEIFIFILLMIRAFEHGCILKDFINFSNKKI